MKPSLIHVFDGLRITTQHMNHLQGAFRSALQDIREILGLGHVYTGFEVVAKGDHAITVLPGLAFDLKKNRIICDEPKTLDVTFGPEEDTKYVTIKYDKVEDGEVEGQFTLIWDSCLVDIRPDMPEPKENLIPIAKLIKLTDDGEEVALRIITLLNTEQSNKLDEIVDEESKEFNDEGLIKVEENNEEIGGEELQIEKGSVQLPSERDTIVTDVEIAKGNEIDEELLNDSIVSPTNLLSGRMHIRQGVVRLAAGQVMQDFGNIVSGPLKKLRVSKSNISDGVFLFTLSEKDVYLDFPIDSLTCNTIISATFSPVEDIPPPKEYETEEEAIPSTTLKLQSTTRGEATFTNRRISQFGVSMIQSYSEELGGIPWQTNEITEIGIGHLPFSFSLSSTNNESLPNTIRILQNLQMIVSVETVNSEGFIVSSKLYWKGGINVKILEMIEKQKLYFTWESAIAWKAIGGLQPKNILT